MIVFQQCRVRMAQPQRTRHAQMNHDAAPGFTGRVEKDVLCPATKARNPAPAGIPNMVFHRNSQGSVVNPDVHDVLVLEGAPDASQRCFDLWKFWHRANSSSWKFPPFHHPGNPPIPSSRKSPHSVIPEIPQGLSGTQLVFLHSKNCGWIPDCSSASPQAPGMTVRARHPENCAGPLLKPLRFWAQPNELIDSSRRP